MNRNRCDSSYVSLAVALTSLCVGCSGDAGMPHAEWPKQVTLFSPGLAETSDGVRLADGAIVTTGGDLALVLAVQLSLVSVGEAPETFCMKGVYETLAAVPVDIQGCVSSIGTPDAWKSRLFLSAAIPHANEESNVIGLGALAYNRARDQIYRLRILGDTVVEDSEGFIGTATATFEYEPLR